MGEKAEKQDTEDLSIDYLRLTILSDLRDLGGKSEIVLIRDSRTSELGESSIQDRGSKIEHQINKFT